MRNAGAEDSEHLLCSASSAELDMVGPNIRIRTVGLKYEPIFDIPWDVRDIIGFKEPCEAKEF